jgi:lipopolysaccharide export LptBFGC system permease protein LptF
MFGWLPLEQQTDDKPIFVSSSYEILKNKVIEKIITRDKTEAEIFAEKQKQNYYKWQEIREQRNKLLDQSDKLVMIDRWEYLADEEKTKITTYRKLLRDLPSQYTDPFSVVFPIL